MICQYANEVVKGALSAERRRVRIMFVWRTLVLIGIVMFFSDACAADLNKMLIAAVQSCDSRAVQKLLAQGADVNAQDENTITVLMYATDCGNKSPELFHLLLDNGADPNMRAPRYRGTTPLIAAAMEGFPDQVKALLEKGADPRQVDDAGKTALMYAKDFGRKDAAAVLKTFVAPIFNE
jgi:ankyrin repeat protein